MRRGMRACALFLFLVGCGSSGPIIGSDDIALPPDGGPDSTLPFDGGADAGADAQSDATKFGGGGPFLCDQCVCDGTIDTCLHISGGASQMPFSDAGDDAGFGDAGTCATDAGGSCAQIPVDCLPNPSCACLLSHHPSCSCDVDPSGNGLVVTCIYP